ncbi:MAG: hypothetical protein KAI06_00975, partial [Anaerolineales bacterium]|nr:hypothetical protein [Anaerolineales bacterium]
ALPGGRFFVAEFILSEAEGILRMTCTGSKSFRAQREIPITTLAKSLSAEHKQPPPPTTCHREPKAKQSPRPSRTAPRHFIPHNNNQPGEKKKEAAPRSSLFEVHPLLNHFPIAACAAANRAIGTRNGEQLT